MPCNAHGHYGVLLINDLPTDITGYMCEEKNFFFHCVTVNPRRLVVTRRMKLQSYHTDLAVTPSIHQGLSLIFLVQTLLSVNK